MRVWAARSLSLRARLSLLLIALVLVACAAVGVASTLALRTFLTQRLDQQLDQAGNRYAVALDHNDHDADNAAASTAGQSIGTLGAVIVGGRVSRASVVSEPGQPVSISPRDQIALATARAGKQHLELPDLGDYRVLASAEPDGDLLVTGLPERGVYETLRHVVIVETVVFAIVVLAAAGTGTFAIRRALRPLQQMTATALRVSELPLAGNPELPERLGGGDPHTEVGQLSLAVNHMLNQIESALHSRQHSEDRLRQFAADASHELRTPVAVVRSHSDLIAQQADALPEQLANSLDRISSESARMSRLVDELLLLARLDSGQPLERRDVDLSRIALDAVDDARLTAPNHRWHLELPPEPVIVPGDPDRLRQVILNLLANARAHTPAGTEVDLALTAGPDQVSIAVRDNGPGIPAELLPHITERFVKGDSSRSHATSSSGLGLAIVASVATAHQGSIAITSRPGATTVEIMLPL
ncbi:MAG: HAMP domain-containing histidine kinase [Actinomycetota bacterium]|nr:HAMP domain-containing histidine kinase [Actinomycetota bacterium]